MELGLYTAPEHIANYIIKNRCSVETLEDFTLLVLRISIVDNVRYAFAEDHWANIYKYVLKLLKLKREYITECQNQIEQNPSARVGGPHFRVAQQRVNETINYLVGAVGANGPPPPYQ